MLITRIFRVICQSRINFITNKEGTNKHLAGTKTRSCFKNNGFEIELSVNQESISSHTKKKLMNTWLVITRSYFKNNDFEIDDGDIKE